MRIQPLIGYLAIGFLVRIADVQLVFLNEEIQLSFEFMASIGIIVLLFRVGLESDLSALISQISHATVIWIGNVCLSGALGFIPAFYLLGLGLIPRLFVAAALTATSVGISADVWHEAEAIKSPNCTLLIDVADMDDISGIAIMAFLFAITPAMKGGTDFHLLPILVKTSGIFFLKAIGFGLICLLFFRYIELNITQTNSLSCMHN
jgi:Kef-type K+ transport system membrane component KefB